MHLLALLLVLRREARVVLAEAREPWPLRRVPAGRRQRRRPPRRPALPGRTRARLRAPRPPLHGVLRVGTNPIVTLAKQPLNMIGNLL